MPLTVTSTRSAVAGWLPDSAARRRFALTGLCAAVVVVSFWTLSRYPALSAKAMLAGTGQVADPMSAWPRFPIVAEFGWFERVLRTTLNWAYENRKGMGFGLVLAALVQTAFTGRSPTSAIQGRSRFGSALRGMLVGAPVGVCVNCAAPIMRGAVSRARPAAALAGMMSSPTLNIVVVVMVFARFPAYVGLLKLLSVFVLVLLVVPLAAPARAQGRCNILPTGRGPASARWLDVLRGCTRDFVHHLRAISVATVPIMVLSGFLGAIIVHTVEFDWSQSSSAGAVILYGIAGTLLPVPIAFDVILTHSLYEMGMPVALAVTLLCSLGPFSLVALVITWQTIGPRCAIILVTATFGLSVICGAVAPWAHEHLYVEQVLTHPSNQLLLPGAPIEYAVDLSSDPPAEVKPAEPIAFEPVLAGAGFRLERRPFRMRSASASQSEGVRLVYHEGPELGLVKGYRHGIRDYPDPFWIGRGTASGDFDGDGWSDVAFGSNRGPLLYRNVGGRFVLEPSAPTPIDTWITYAVALVDLDNDGWLDLYFTTFNRGTYAAMNREGEIDWARLIRIPNGDGILTVAPAFADITGNGRLDIVAGNMALGIITGFRELGEGRRNALVLNRGDHFEPWVFPGDDAETMSTLVSDLDSDGQLDIYFSNDFDSPDVWFQGLGNGKLKPVPLSDPTPIFSMSADSGDVDGDGQIDLLLTGTIALQPWVGTTDLDERPGQELVAMRQPEATCASIEDRVTRANCMLLVQARTIFADRRNVRVDECDRLPTPFARQQCWLAATWSIVTQEHSQSACSAVDDPLIDEICRVLDRRGARIRPSGAPQRNDQFIYLGRGATRERMPNFRHPGGWTWNTRLVDVDGDGWLDLLGAQATVGETQPGFNTLMVNREGTAFDFEAFSAGWADEHDLFSYTVIDYDIDGDPDIIGNGSVGPVAVFENRSPPEHHWLGLQLRDFRGNRFAVGARAELRVGSRRLVREIKASGGYQSFDDPSLRFGLGSAQSGDQLRVRWPDGTKMEVETTLEAGWEYRLVRR